MQVNNNYTKCICINIGDFISYGAYPYEGWKEKACSSKYNIHRCASFLRLNAIYYYSRYGSGELFRCLDPVDGRVFTITTYDFNSHFVDLSDQRNMKIDKIFES